MAPFAAVTRRERILSALRYYGFAIALVVVGLGIFVVTALEYTKSRRNAEQATTGPGLAELQALASNAQRDATPLPDVLGAALNVFTTPTGASVAIDGVPRGQTPIIGHGVRPGYYLLTVTYDGFAPRDTLIDVTAGGSVFVSLDLEADGSATTLEEPREVIRVAQPPARQAPVRQAPPATARPERVVTRTPAVRTGALAVVTDPPDARVLLDGAAAGVAPIVLADVPVGEHEVVVHAPGFAAASRTVTVSADQQETVRVTLRAQEGVLSVLVQPWGSIYVGDTLLKRDTDVLFTTRLPTGFHRVRVVHPTLGEQVQTVEVRPGATARIDFQFDTN